MINAEVKEKLNNSVNEFNSAKEELFNFINKNLDNNTKMIIMAKINNLLSLHSSATVSSEFHYSKDPKFDMFVSKIWENAGFDDPRKAKLYDTLLQILPQNGSDIHCVIRMIANMER